MILEGWRDAVLSGRYSSIHYHCSSPSVAHWIPRLAKKVRLTAPEFSATVQMTAAQIAALSPAAGDADAVPVRKPQRSGDAAPPGEQQLQIAPLPAPVTTGPVNMEQAAPPATELETPEAAAERERRYREIFGIPEPSPRRRWRR